CGNKSGHDVSNSYNKVSRERCPACHPERSEGSLRQARQILRFAQDDRPSLQMSDLTLPNLNVSIQLKQDKPVIERVAGHVGNDNRRGIMADRNDWNRHTIEEFRANGGKVGGMWEGRPLLLLTTTGAKSRKQHMTPTIYLP